MGYKVVKLRHFSGKRFIFRIVNTGANGSQMFGVNKSFDTGREAESFMHKGLFRGRF